MTRRGFLQLLLATAAAEALDPEAFERLIWTQKPLIVVPAMPGTYGDITRSTFVWWRNQTVGGLVGSGKFETLLSELYNQAGKGPEPLPPLDLTFLRQGEP
jgi:hypothetical protein